LVLGTAKALVEFSTVKSTGVGEFGSGSFSVCAEMLSEAAAASMSATTSNRHDREFLKAIFSLL
jgi:hypothetical protein